MTKVASTRAFIVDGQVNHAEGSQPNGNPLHGAQAFAQENRPQKGIELSCDKDEKQQ